MRRTKNINRLSRPGRDHIKAKLLIRFLSSAEDGELHFRAMEVFKMCRELKAKPGLNHPINAHLEELPFVAYFDYAGAIHWRPAARHGKTSPPAPLTGKELGTIGPGVAIKLILDMYEAGTLDRVRQCVCGKWFYAANNKKSTCSDACRFEKFKQEHPDFNEERAEYMRNLRKSERNRQRKQRAVAARKGK